MPHQPHVSIVIPTYNGAPFLRQCIQSALAQTERDIEILIVDDASSDDTVRVAEMIARQDPRVRVVVNERNLGLVGNWNNALQHARGEWIKFLFQDDLLAPSCVERLVAAALATGASFAACARDFVFENDPPADEQRRYHENRELVATLARGGRMSPTGVAEFAIDNVGINFVGEPTVTLLRRSLFDRIGVFDVSLAQRCDTEYWVRVGVHEGVTFVEDTLATFRVHGASASAANYARRQFADQLLDPIIILHHYLFDIAYAPLRSVAGRAGSMARLTRRFWNACADAARAMNASSGDSEATLKAEWQRVLARYPRLATIPVTRRIARLSRRCARALRRTLQAARPF